MIPIGTIVSLAGQAASGIMSAINNKRERREKAAESARREAHYEAQAAENPLLRADVRSVIGAYDRSSRQQIAEARNIGKITGGTPESAVAIQQAVANGRSDLISDIASDNSKRVDEARKNAETARQDAAAAEVARREVRNQTYANLATNAANAFGSIVNSYGTPSVDTGGSQKETDEEKKKTQNGGEG